MFRFRLYPQEICQTLAQKIWQTRHKCNLSIQVNILRKQKFLKILNLFIIFALSAKKLRSFGGKISAGLSNLHSVLQRNLFRNFFLSFSEFERKYQVLLPKKVSTRMSKLNLHVQMNVLSNHF